MFLKISQKANQIRSILTSRKDNKKGQALLELIVAVVIIGIIVAIIAPDLGRSTEDTKIARAKSDIKVLSGALDIYYADTGKKLSGEISTSGGEICNTLTSADTKTDGSPGGPWIKSCPVPPWSDVSYQITQDNSGSAFRHVVTITSPNGVTISSKNLATTTSN